MKVITKKKQTLTKAARRLVDRMKTTAGWRERKEIGTLLERVRIDFGAAVACDDSQDYDDMLANIADGINGTRELVRYLKRLGVH